jgi:hypothetical protein
MATDLDERLVHHALDPYSDTGSIKSRTHRPRRRFNQSRRGKKRDGDSDSGQGPEFTTAGPQAGSGCRNEPQAGSVRADPAGADPAGLTRPSKPPLAWAGASACSPCAAGTYGGTSGEWGGGMGFSLPRAGSGVSSAEMRGALPRGGHVCHLSSSRDY